MFMLLGVIFWTEVENFDRVRDYLRKTHGLVPPIWRDGSLAEEHVETHLVYEDPNLVSGKLNGVYRANFQIEDPHGPHIGFRYYGNRLNPRIREEDPMKAVILGTYDLLKPVKVTDWAISPIDLEHLLHP